MPFELKPIGRDAIPVALQKAERYRLLNEPSEAQSICEDILQIDPGHQEALVMLLLALTDQIGEGVSAAEARALLPRLTNDYQRAYYAGVICERSAKGVMKLGRPGWQYTAYDSLVEGMQWFEKAELLRPLNNDDALLRWNTCARTLMRNPALQPRELEPLQEVFGE